MREHLSHPLRNAGLAFALYSGLTAALLFPLLSQLPTAVFGGAGDALGTVWALWWSDFAPTQGWSKELAPLLAYPFGADLRAALATMLPYQAAARALAPLGDEILRYNLLLLLSFPLNGIAAYLLARRLMGGLWPPLWAGAIYSFSPYLWAHSSTHLGLAHAWFLPLLLLLTLNLLEHPRWWRALLLGLALALTTLFQAYYGYIGAALMAALALAHGAFHHGFRLKEWTGPRPLLLMGAAALLGIMLLASLLLPMGRTLLDPNLRDTLEPLGYPSHARALAPSAAQPWQYLMPPPEHRLLASLVEGFWAAQRLPDGTEFRLYLGLLPIVLSFVALSSPATLRLSPERRLARFLAVAILATAFFLSLAPRLWPLDSLLSTVLPIFRVYARFGIGVMLGCALLAASGLEHLLQKASPRWRPWLAMAVLAVSLLDLVPQKAMRTFDATLPEPYALLAKLDRGTVLAEYPLLEESEVHGRYLLAQRIHQKAFINSSSQSAPLRELHQSLQDLEDPEVPGRLAALGVDYIMVHQDLYRGREPTNSQPPDLAGNAAFEPVASSGPLALYRLHAKPLELARDVTFEGDIRLLNAQAYLSVVEPGTTVTVTVTLSLPGELPPNYGFFVHLDDVNQQTVAQETPGLPPLQSWPPRLTSGEEGTTFDVRVHLPEGVERELLTYRLGIYDSALLRNLPVIQGSRDHIGQRAIAAGALLVRGAAVPPLPTNPARVRFAGGLELLGFETPLVDREEGRIRLATVWRKNEESARSYTQFYHLLDEAGRIVAQLDQTHRQNHYPSAVWAIGEAVPEMVEISLPSPLAPGLYTIFAGLYGGPTGQRLPVLASSLPTHEDGVVLSQIAWP